MGGVPACPLFFCARRGAGTGQMLLNIGMAQVNGDRRDASGGTRIYS